MLQITPSPITYVEHFFPDFLAAAGSRGGMGIGGTPVVLVSNLNEEVRMIWSLDSRTLSSQVLLYLC